MRALTICQPYAELILRGEKLVENRTWEVLYRGPLLIHAGKSRAWMDTYSPLPERMDFGAIVGVSELVGCLHITKIDAYQLAGTRFVRLLNHLHCEGPFCWVLENVRRFATPIPYRGAQGIFNVPDSLVQEAVG